MKNTQLFTLALASAIVLINVSCKKDSSENASKAIAQEEVSSKSSSASGQNYLLEVVLRGAGSSSGHIHFRQDRDEAKIIDLGVMVHNLLPNHEYKLQRAVDAANVVDGECTSTSWLTLGYGLDPGSIMTDDKGDGSADLWRNVAAIPSGSRFDIHFRVIDAASSEVVLNSDCYQYTVR